MCVGVCVWVEGWTGGCESNDHVLTITGVHQGPQTCEKSSASGQKPECPSLASALQDKRWERTHVETGRVK